MADDWAKTTAQKVASRIAEEAERAGTLRRRFDEGINRFRKQALDLVSAVNANIEAETNRIQVIVLDNGIILAAAYKRIVTVEELGAVPGVPACVGQVTLQREDRKAATQPEPEKVFITTSATQTTFYRQVGKDLKILGDAEFKQLIEYFAT